MERDNPVRLAMGPQSLVRLETDFVREDDDRIDALRITLEKCDLLGALAPPGAIVLTKFQTCPVSVAIIFGLASG